MSILEPSDFSYIADLVMNKTGVLLEEDQHDFVRKRVLPIAREGGFDEIADLVDQLQMSPNSKLHSRVIEAVLEDETMFFRDFSSYKFLRHEVAKDLFAQRAAKKELNVWCAACSSGQEAYSISIMLKDALKQFGDWKINLLATDISPSLIKKAKVGISNDYGAKRRKVANLDKIGELISNAISDSNNKNNITVRIVSTDGLHLYVQIFPYINKKNIWLGHGAGMFFTLFMKNGSNVVEIIPLSKVKELNGAAQGLKRIADDMKNFHLDRIIL